MNKILYYFVGIVFVVVLLTASGTLYTIDETQQVVITQFGELKGEPQKKAGLYFKIPFIQTVNSFDKRILQWDGDANQMPTLQKKFIWVDTTARWRIVDPLLFMQSVRTELSAQTRLDDIIDASTRQIISSHQLIETIRSSNRLIEEGNMEEEASENTDVGETALESIKIGREQLAEKIRQRASEAVANYGIELIDVRIKRINYAKEVQREVFERMKEERKRAAQKFRSEGSGKKLEMEGQIDRQLKEIQSKAYKKSQEITGKADAQAIKIYADAYNQDPEFYSFLKSLESYRKTINDDTTLIFATDSDLYRYLTGDSPTPSPATP